MTASEMFKQLGFIIKENNMDRYVGALETYITWQSEDYGLRISFDQCNGVDVSVFKYLAETHTNIVVLHSTLLKAIMTQIDEIEKNKKGIK